jgi:uncharacterized membrane protein
MRRGIVNKPNRAFLFFLFLLIPIFILCYTCETSFEIDPMYLFLIITAMPLTSLIEIPVHRMRTKKPSYSMEEAAIVGKIYSVPVADELAGGGLVYDSLVTLNPGGFVLPLSLAVYLITNVSSLEILMVSSIMIIATYLFSEIRKGIGVVVPGYVSLLALPIAFVIAPENAAAVILASGVVGILVGIIVRLFAIKEEEGSAFFNIGGTGSFNAVYMAVILAVLVSFFV